MTTGSAERGAALVKIARSALEEAVLGREMESGEAPDLFGDEPRATFVTLKREGELRGCIGTLEPCRRLAEDIRRNARAAALHDTRFGPVRAEELEEISLEVSVLSPLEEMGLRDEEHLLSLLRPGIDGLVIAHQGRRATFLPQVWTSLPQRAEFVRALKAKAGLSRSFWADDIRAWRFTVEMFAE